MKLFRNTILAVLGLAVAGFASSCSDDHKYYPGEQSPGAYFEHNLPASYDAADANGVIYVQMDRTSADTQSSFDLVMEDPSGLFTAPSSVTFEGANLTTQIPISFAPAALTEGKAYPIKLTVKDASQYGPAEYSFTISIPDPIVTKNFGVGTYIFNGCWKGSQGPLPSTITYNEKNPDVVTLTIGVKGGEEAWGLNGGQLNVVFQDFNHPDANGNVYCTVPEQYVFSDEDGDIMVSDIGAFMAANGGNPAPYAKDSYYNVNTGLLTLHNAYYVRGTTMWYGDKNIEYYQLEGFPDYSVSIEYRGALLGADGSLNALAVFNTNATDVAALKAVCVAGTDAQAALAAILEGESGVVDVPTGENVEQSFPISGGGDYIIMGVTFDAAGKPQELDYVQFQINIGASEGDKNWSDVGTADFADGWITAAFSRGGVPLVVEDEMFPVAIQKNNDDPTLYRMVDPWGSKFPIASLNAYPAKRNIEFVIDGKDYVCFMPQLSGFGTSNWGGEMTIGNYTGMVREQNPEASNAAIANFIASKNNELLLSYFEDNIVTVNLPMFGAPGIQDGTFGYNWKNIQASLLIMPEAGAPARAKAKAARVANPTFRGIAARAIMTGLQKRVPIQRNLNNVPALGLRK